MGSSGIREFQINEKFVRYGSNLLMFKFSTVHSNFDEHLRYGRRSRWGVYLWPHCGSGWAPIGLSFYAGRRGDFRFAFDVQRFSHCLCDDFVVLRRTFYRGLHGYEHYPFARKRWLRLSSALRLLERVAVW